MIHQVGLTLPRPHSTVKIINAVARRVPLSAQRSAPRAMLISQSRAAKCPPKAVRAPVNACKNSERRRFLSKYRLIPFEASEVLPLSTYRP